MPEMTSAARPARRPASAFKSLHNITRWWLHKAATELLLHIAPATKEQEWRRPSRRRAGGRTQGSAAEDKGAETKLQQINKLGAQC